jgi:hypothetical protein
MKWVFRLLGCAIAGVVVLFVLIGIFWLGTRVGTLQAARSSMTEDRGKQAIEQSSPLFGIKVRPHGALGDVLRIEGENIIIGNRSGAERTVYVTSDTIIQRNRVRITVNEIQTGERLIAIGSPQIDNEDNGIEARFIRLFEPGSKPTPEHP